LGIVPDDLVGRKEDAVRKRTAILLGLALVVALANAVSDAAPTG
jgi:hypothetical protein